MSEKHMNRRTFLKTATAAAVGLALPTIVPARALGRAARSPEQSHHGGSHWRGGMGSGDCRILFGSIRSSRWRLRLLQVQAGEMGRVR